MCMGEGGYVLGEGVKLACNRACNTVRLTWDRRVTE